MTTNRALCGTYWPGLTHERLMEELELGPRVAAGQESEDLGWSALDTVLHREWWAKDTVAKHNERLHHG